ncbi:MAG: D-aminoacyl-tRNA deacylase [Flavobacteriales bacterium]
MRCLIQRTLTCKVHIKEKIHSSIPGGLFLLLGIEDADTSEDIDWLCNKIANMRIFPDTQGVMNLSVMEAEQEIMVVSQFTLHASTKKGNRPSYIKAARPEKAIPLYEAFVKKIGEVSQRPVKTGVFGAEMKIEFTNNGPVTLLIDSKNRE